MTSIRELLDSAGLRSAGVVRWGQPLELSTPGVYLVSTTPDTDETVGTSTVSIDRDSVRSLLAMRPEATVDGVAATEASVTARLKALWVPGELVVYIGLAGTSVAQRVNQYYRTSIGARVPHAGGWPVKMLAGLDHLWVHYAAADDPDTAESSLLRAFADGLDPATVTKLHDTTVVLPFANLQRSAGLFKAHGFSGVKAPRTTGATPAPNRPALVRDFVAAPPRPLVTGSQLRTQNVTPTDIAAGRIRVPSATKAVFPADKALVHVELSGERLSCRWNPKHGPDRERSGVISVPRETLARLVSAGSPLVVTVADCVIRLGRRST